MIQTAPIPNSSSVKAMGYDAASLTLQVDFKSGRSYVYRPVPPEVHSNILAAKSPGSYLHKNVINVYDYQEILSP